MASLDIIHLFSLIRLRSEFPMAEKSRHRLKATLENKDADTATDMFFKIVMSEFLHEEDRPEAHLLISNSGTTSDIAAAGIRYTILQCNHV